MRAFSGAFSLVGLLVVLCICLVIWRKYEYPVMKTGAQLHPVVEEMSGRGANGEDASRSITYEPDYKNNQLKGLIVKTIEAGGPMEKHFGLEVGDEIIKVGQTTVDTYGSDELAELQGVFTDGFEKDMGLTVIRKGQSIMLPKGANPDGSSNLPQQLRNIHVPG